MLTTVSLLRRMALLFLFCSALGPRALAQDSAASPPLYRIVLSDLRTTLEDGLSFWSAPVRFSATEWMIAGGTVAGTIGVISLDGDLRRKFGTETDDRIPHTFWEIPTYYGDLRYASLFSGGVYAAGLVSGDRSIRVTGRLLVESLLLSGSAVLALRYMTGRISPGPKSDPWDFRGFQWDSGRQSFPSGHAMVAFAVSTVLAEQIDNTVARIGLYGLASVTSYARVRFDQHWTSDMLVGAALGIAAGLHVVSRERVREGQSEQGEGMSITPIPGGLRLQYTFR
jgi:hypothetical protein